MIINNKKIKNYTLSEFSENPIKYAHSQLILNLDGLRDFIECVIFPSPVPGALARFDSEAKDSQHYAKFRLSTAIDIFIDCDPFRAWNKILYSKLFNRAGIYFDTYYKNKKWVMFHVDLKDQDLLWFRDKNDPELQSTEGYYYSYKKDFYSKLLKKFYE